MTASEKYYENPNYCVYCGEVIMIRDNEKACQTRVKKFCDSSCSAKSRNKNHKRVLKRKCANCGDGVKHNLVFCSRKCRLISNFLQSSVSNSTKGEMLMLRKGWQSARSAIRKNAAVSFVAYEKDNKCSVCGYKKHTDIAHIKAVKYFDDDSLIKDINHPDNLIALCPNHHWEFDNGLLEL